MKPTHVYSLDHGVFNRKIKKQKKYQIPEINAVKPEKNRENERKLKPAGEVDVRE